MQKEMNIYKTSDGAIQVDVNIIDDTVWLSLNQMAKVFDRDKSVISRHLTNIFKNKELDRNSVVANFATTASDGKEYKIDYYNLDAIISVGYRVNSKRGIHFRKWASEILKTYLIKGYTINKNRLAEKGLQELEQTLQLLQKALVSHQHVDEIGEETIQLIANYAKTWKLLLAYDEDNLKVPTSGKTFSKELDYITTKKAIESLKIDLSSRNEATSLFGNERDKGLESILNNIEQTFGGEQLYKTAEEKAANLLYFIIKDHPFTDGNKRISCLVFLLYLKLQNITVKFNQNGLVALALLIAESAPSQKDIMVKLTINLLVD